MPHDIETVGFVLLSFVDVVAGGLNFLKRKNAH